jgi:enoyl-CoA hydratase/carnithine racemase
MTRAVRYDLRSRVAQVTLAGESGNVLNTPVIEAIRDHVGRAIDDPECRVIVLRADGADFCRGLDFGAVHADTGDLRAMAKAFAECVTLVHGAPKPVIACLEGHVVGGGVGLAAACDIVLAQEHVTFTLPEAIVGMIPAVITPFLLRRMSAGRVRYLAISTRALPAAEAARFGLVDELVGGEMRHALNTQLKRLFRTSPMAVAEMKRRLQQLDGGRLQREIDGSLEQLDAWLDQRHAIDGVRTFADGFSPSWFEKYTEQT